MMTTLKSHWPIIVNLGLYLVIIAVLLAQSVAGAGGHFVYALDDAYIQLAIARSLAEHGVWGVSPDGFTSSSSSLLWTLLVALALCVFGSSDLGPFVLNLLFAVLTQLYLYLLLRRYRLNSTSILLVLVAFVFFTPLTGLVFSGLEHTAHVLLTLAFAHTAARLLCENEKDRSRSYVLLLLAPLATMARFESLFLLAVVGLLFFMKRRFLYPIALGVAGALPVVAFGLYSLHQGWYFLPNSVLIKGNIPNLHNLETVFKAACQSVQVKTIPLSVLIVLTAIVAYARYRREGRLWSLPTVMALIFVLAAILHLQFADIGALLRYEAYLVGLSVVALALAFSLPTDKPVPARETVSGEQGATSAAGGRSAGLSSWLLLLALPLVWRGLIGLLVVPVATKNIYDQQYQMGLFVGRFYAGSAVAANDIGTINYLADVHCVDLVGLANLQVGKWKMARAYDTAKIDQLTKELSVKIAIVYDEWFDRYGGLPKQWTRVGQWRIPYNAVCSEDTVSIYAVDPAGKERLIENLKAFAPELPEDVTQTGLYTE